MKKDLPILGKQDEKEIFTPALQTKNSEVAVGLPDDADINNIKVILRNYELARPGEIKVFVKAAKAEQKELNNDFGSNAKSAANIGGDYRKAVTMPIGLFRIIEEAYPLMFTNKTHLHWFMRKFPQFCVARKV